MSIFRKLTRAAGPIVPLRLRRALNDRLVEYQFGRLVRAKRRFRAGRRPATQPGVNLIAYIRAEMGLGVVARGMAAALHAAEVPFNIINIESGNASQHTDRSWAHKEVTRSDYDTTIVFMNPDQSVHLRENVQETLLARRYVVAQWYWELPELPDAWLKECDFVDEIWVASQFIEVAVASKSHAMSRSPVPVVRIPPVVMWPDTPGGEPSLTRAQLGLPANRYLFLAMFDRNSLLQRKNPLGVLRAFTAAFAPDDATVGLVLKFNNSDSRDPLLNAVREEMVGRQNVFVVDRIMKRAEVMSLMNACDCFVSLHRSEGFGLAPAEAMSLGKPSIVTHWSGNVDYMTADNSVPIDYALVTLGQDYGPYKAHQQWAEPDLDQAAHWMRRLRDHPDIGQRLGHQGRQTIRSLYAPPVVGAQIRARLEQIREGLHHG